MPDEVSKEIITGIIEREDDTIDIMLASRVTRSAVTIEEYINIRLLQGASRESIKRDLLADLESGGRLFGEFRNSIKSTVRGSVNRLRDSAQVAEIGTKMMYRWVAVMINTCPDCLARHGQVHKWETWEAEGLPRTGATVCGDNCKCVLIPEDVVEIEPVRR